MKKYQWFIFAFLFVITSCRDEKPENPCSEIVSDQGINFSSQDFVAEDLDSMLVCKYAKNSRFTTLINSFYINTSNDSLHMADSSNNSISFSTAFDYKLILKNKETYFLDSIVIDWQPQFTMTSGTWVCDIDHFRINGHRYNDRGIHISKRDTI